MAFEGDVRARPRTMEQCLPSSTLQRAACPRRGDDRNPVVLKYRTGYHSPFRIGRSLVRSPSGRFAALRSADDHDAHARRARGRVWRHRHEPAVCIQGGIRRHARAAPHHGERACGAVDDVLGRDARRLGQVRHVHAAFRSSRRRRCARPADIRVARGQGAAPGRPPSRWWVRSPLRCSTAMR